MISYVLPAQFHLHFEISDDYSHELRLHLNEFLCLL